MDSSIKDLSRYRFETSLENITDAKIMYDNGRYKNTLNRTYYSIFHAIRAVCALDGFDSSKHSGVISYFNQNYVKTDIFPKDLSKVIRYASENREKADYLKTHRFSPLSVLGNRSKTLLLLIISKHTDLPTASRLRSE